jgi:uncharacterized protein (TIGR02466 family)|tara:strand:- start:1141 stop:1767 length:627 start_codon:yes stop_codon:yes gene_type:complete
MKEELLQIFPKPVLILPYEKPISKELEFIRTLEWLAQKANGNFKSKDSYVLKHEKLKDIKNFLMESINKYCEKILNTKQRLVITQSWFNKNPTGSKHHEHVHPNSIVSGVMYFQIDQTLPPIQFSKSNQDGVKLDPIKYNVLNSDTFLLPCKPGELILFPSNLRHSVPINTGMPDRISLSFNTFCIDALGSEDSLTHLDIRRLMNEHN